MISGRGEKRVKLSGGLAGSRSWLRGQWMLGREDERGRRWRTVYGKLGQKNKEGQEEVRKRREGNI